MNRCEACPDGGFAVCQDCFCEGCMKDEAGCNKCHADYIQATRPDHPDQKAGEGRNIYG